MLKALTRQVGASFSSCLLTHVQRQPIDLPRARQQHLEYEAILRQLDVQVLSLPAEDDLPDSVFVEDPAVVTDELAIIAFMGAKERRPECESIARELARYRPVERMPGPGSLDGGDVLQIHRRFYVGLSDRTNQAGIEDFRALVTPHGYEVTAVPVHGCLHLKSACTYIGKNTVLLHPGWVDPTIFSGFDTLPIHPQEPWAANALLVGNTVLVATASPRTRDGLTTRGFETLPVDISEFMKAEGALTCKCILFRT